IDRECFRNDECCDNTPVCFPTPTGNECITYREPKIQRFVADTNNQIPAFDNSENPAENYESCYIDNDCCDGGICQDEPIPTSYTFVESSDGSSDIEIGHWNCEWENVARSHCFPAPFVPR